MAPVALVEFSRRFRSHVVESTGAEVDLSRDALDLFPRLELVSHGLNVAAADKGQLVGPMKLISLLCFLFELFFGC